MLLPLGAELGSPPATPPVPAVLLSLGTGPGPLCEPLALGPMGVSVGFWGEGEGLGSALASAVGVGLTSVGVLGVGVLGVTSEDPGAKGLGLNVGVGIGVPGVLAVGVELDPGAEGSVAGPEPVMLGNSCGPVATEDVVPVEEEGLVASGCPSGAPSQPTNESKKASTSIENRIPMIRRSLPLTVQWVLAFMPNLLSFLSAKRNNNTQTARAAPG